MTSHVEVCWNYQVFALNLVKEKKNDLRTVLPPSEQWRTARKVHYLYTWCENRELK